MKNDELMKYLKGVAISYAFFYGSTCLLPNLAYTFIIGLFGKILNKNLTNEYATIYTIFN
jgi:hypothetical protein